MSLAGTALISSMLFGFEILWLKFFGSHMLPGPIAFLLPVIFFGGAVGAALIARFPNLSEKSFNFIAAGLLAALLSIVQPILNITAMLSALMACVLWGMAQTSLISKSVSPTRTIAASVAGLVPLLILPIFLERASVIQIAVPFAAINMFGLVLLSRKWLWLPLAALPFAWWQPSVPGTYPTALANLHVRSSDSLPTGLHSRSPNAEWSKQDPSFRTWQIFRNGYHASDVVDAMSLTDLELLKSDELFPFMVTGEKKSVALVGTGGGREILYARLAGFKKITAVEINAGMVKAARDYMRNPDLAYGAPEVTTAIADGRDFFRQTNEKFDLIVLSDARNYGTTLSLQFAENYLLTDEALADYVDHLTPDGTLLYRMNGRDAELVDAHHASALATLRTLATDKAEVGLIRRRKGRNSTNGFVIAYRKGGFSEEQKSKIQTALATRPTHARFVQSNKLHPRGYAQRLTDDRPYPFWQKASMAGVWAAVFTLFLLMRGFVSFQSDKRSEILTGGFLSGIAFIAIQVFTVEQSVFQSGDPIYTPILALACGLLVSSLGYWQASRDSKWPDLWFVIVAWVTAVFALKGISSLPLTSLTRGMLAAIISAVPLYFSAKLYARLLAQAHQHNQTALFLAVNGCGLLLGGIGSKLIAIEFGATALAFLCLVTLSRVALSRRT
jgi:spermidine synthase